MRAENNCINDWGAGGTKSSHDKHTQKKLYPRGVQFTNRGDTHAHAYDRGRLQLFATANACDQLRVVTAMHGPSGGRTLTQHAFTGQSHRISRSSPPSPTPRRQRYKCANMAVNVTLIPSTYCYRDGSPFCCATVVTAILRPA